jgi:hypothetical protein
MNQLLEELPTTVNIHVRVENEPPPISENYREVTPLSHLIKSRNCPLCIDCTYENLFYQARASFTKERLIKVAHDRMEKFKKNENQQMYFHGQLKNGKQTIQGVCINRYK